MTPEELARRGVRVEHRVDGSTAYEVLPGHESPFRVPLAEGRTVDFELPPNPPIRVMDGREFPQLGAALVLVQPEVFRQDRRRGWCPIGGTHYDSELEIGEPDSTLVFERQRGNVCLWVHGPHDLTLERTGSFPMYVISRPAVPESSSGA